jgi:hypothetical protein
LVFHASAFGHTYEVGAEGWSPAQVRCGAKIENRLRATQEGNAFFGNNVGGAEAEAEGAECVVHGLSHPAPTG